MFPLNFIVLFLNSQQQLFDDFCQLLILILSPIEKLMSALIILFDAKPKIKYVKKFIIKKTLPNSQSRSCLIISRMVVERNPLLQNLCKHRILFIFSHLGNHPCFAKEF
jgi:hypothetical protein